jgi:tRNA A-37 threonylcarbamoyl transferase component Bud32
LAKEIDKQGIPTIVPQRVKDIRKWGLLDKSLVLTEYKQNCLDLEGLLIKRPVQDKDLHRKIIREYGKLARSVHAHNIYQEDFDPNNILYQEGQYGSFQLYFLDFERTRILKRLSLRKRVHSLAKLNRMGKKLGITDQMRFLRSYLGPEATKEDCQKWVKDIQEEEKNVFLRDQRRAVKECTSRSNRVGPIKYHKYQGFYRKRHHSYDYYTQNDIICLIHAIEGAVSGEREQQSGLDHFYLTVQLDTRTETFQIVSFRYGGLKQLFQRPLNNTPLLSAWKEDNACLKNRKASFLPVAAVEKRIAMNQYQGFLIRKG